MSFFRRAFLFGKIATLGAFCAASTFAGQETGGTCISKPYLGRESLSLRCVLEKSLNASSGFYFHPTPLVAQARDYTCGVAAMQSVLAYYGDDEFMEGTLARLLKADPKSGTSYDAMLKLLWDASSADALEKLKKTKALDETPELSDSYHKPPVPFSPYTSVLRAGRSSSMRTISQTGEEGVPEDGMSRAELRQELRLGHPVILTIQAWAPARSAYREDSYGHYVVAVGYSPTHVFLMDPSSTGNYASVRWDELSARWHDIESETVNGIEKTVPLRHFGLVITKGAPAYDYDAVPAIP